MTTPESVPTRAVVSDEDREKAREIRRDMELVLSDFEIVVPGPSLTMGQRKDQAVDDTLARALIVEREKWWNAGQKAIRQALADGAEKYGEKYISVQLLRAVVLLPLPPTPDQGEKP